MIPILLALASTPALAPEIAGAAPAVAPATAPADLFGDANEMVDHPGDATVLILYQWGNGITVARADYVPGYVEVGGLRMRIDHEPVVGHEIVADGFRWRVVAITRYAGWQVVASVEPGETWGWRTDR